MCEHVHTQGAGSMGDAAVLSQLPSTIAVFGQDRHSTQPFPAPGILGLAGHTVGLGREQLQKGGTHVPLLLSLAYGEPQNHSCLLQGVAVQSAKFSQGQQQQQTGFLFGAPNMYICTGADLRFSKGEGSTPALRS